MTSRPQKQQVSKLPVRLVSIFLIFFLIISAVYFFMFEDMTKGDSLFQDWKEYYVTENWNLSMHAYADIDGDGLNDMVSLDNCAYLTTVDADDIPLDRRCTRGGHTNIGFPDQPGKVGQSVDADSVFSSTGLRKAYLVKTQQDVWKYYDMRGLHLSTFVLNDQMQFTRTNPTILDWVDVLVYQTSHAGLTLFLLLFTPLLLMSSLFS